MQRENKCHCSRTDRLHRIDSNYKNHTPEKCWTERENKTMEERFDDHIVKEKIDRILCEYVKKTIKDGEGLPLTRRAIRYMATDEIMSIIKSEIDLARAEERKEVVDLIMNTNIRLDTNVGRLKFINLITNRDEKET